MRAQKKGRERAYFAFELSSYGVSLFSFVGGTRKFSAWKFSFRKFSLQKIQFFENLVAENLVAL